MQSLSHPALQVDCNPMGKEGDHQTAIFALWPCHSSRKCDVGGELLLTFHFDGYPILISITRNGVYKGIEDETY